MRKRERRRPHAWRLRIYVDAIREAEATTDEQWMAAWAANCRPDSTYVSRRVWLEILTIWALREARALGEAAAA